jgi:F-type H+-transporting ATPase subunit delta
MSAGSLARRYARAVIDLGQVQGNLDKLGEDLRSMSNAMKASPELMDLLTNPVAKKSDRKKVVGALLERFAAHQTSKNLANLLLDGERMAAVPSISREVDAMIEARAGRVSAEVTSAQTLTAAQVASITQGLEKLSGKKIVLTKKEDPSILGGVIAKVGDVIYDGSVRSQLRNLRDELQR